MRDLSGRGLLALALTVGFVTIAHGQGSPPRIEVRLSDPVFASWISQPKIAECIDCHYEASLGARLAGRLTSFSRREELEAWLQDDKHTIARRRVEPIAESETRAELERLVQKLDAIADDYSERLNLDRSQIFLDEFPKEWIGLSNVLSRRICDQLWGQGHVDSPEGYQDFRDNCLTCHGGYEPADEGFELAGRMDAPIGIDCLYCHESGGTDWREDHYGSGWRVKPAEEKSKSGMRDLVDTANQSGLCFDCHIGNRDKQMFVSHEMYAAGHPPLPSVEVETFCQQMPQHWQTPEQLYRNLGDDDETREPYFQTNYPGLTNPAEIYWDTRKMLIGVLAARKKTAELLVDSAESHRWADYSLYDCAACHHELRSTSLRQQRGYPGAPGRPRLHEWPQALFAVAAKLGGGDPSLMSLEERLSDAITVIPFGDPQAASTVARELIDELDRVIDRASRTPVDATKTRAIVADIAGISSKELLTYDAARQVAWALRVIAAEAVRKGDPLPGPTEQLIASLDQPTSDGEVTGIDTSLPATRENFIYKDGLRKDLKLRADYQPDVFAERLQEIAAAVEQ